MLELGGDQRMNEKAVLPVSTTNLAACRPRN